jgi:hypothetical protein
LGDHNFKNENKCSGTENSRSMGQKPMEHGSPPGTNSLESIVEGDRVREEIIKNIALRSHNVRETGWSCA